MQTQVSRYGIHLDQDNIAWLEQEDGGTSVCGLKKSPFHVSSQWWWSRCNHQINLECPPPSGHFPWWDPLVGAMLPVPKTYPDPGIFYLEDSDHLLDILEILERMSSPRDTTIRMFWDTDGREVVKNLAKSNVQPRVFYGAKAGDIATIREMALPAAKSSGKLVIVGLKEIVLPTVVRKIETNLKYDEIKDLPWKEFGAAALRKWMEEAG